MGADKTFDEKISILKKVLNSEPRMLIDQKIEVSSLTQFDRDVVEIRMTGYLYGEYQKPIQVSFPASWWQLFKLNWFPFWLLKISPSKCHMVEFNPRIVYLELLEPDIELTKLEPVMLRELPREMINEVRDIESLAQSELEGIRHYFRMFVVESENISCPYPKNLWQAIKERWFPAWLKTRYPIAYYQHDFCDSSDLADCHFDITYPNQKYIVQIGRGLRDKSCTNLIKDRTSKNRVGKRIAPSGVAQSPSVDFE